MQFPNDSFDFIFSNFVVMFIPKRNKAFQEIHRVLKPNGRSTISVWDTIENNVSITNLYKAIDSTLGDPSKSMMSNIPSNKNFALSNPIQFKNELLEAGFKDVNVKTFKVKLNVQFEELFQMALRNFPLKNKAKFKDNLKEEFKGQDSVDIETSTHIAYIQK